LVRDERKYNIMKRTYVPFYLNKTTNTTYFYDYKKQLFFTKSRNKQQNGCLPILAGMVGVLFFVVFKDFVIQIGSGNGCLVILLSLLLSSILAFGMMYGIRYLSKDQEKLYEEIVHPNEEEIQNYICEGRKWLRTTLYLVLVLFLFNVVSILFLILMPNNGLLFFSNTVLWAILLFMVWTIRPIKRNTLYRHLQRDQS